MAPSIGMPEAPVLAFGFGSGGGSGFGGGSSSSGPCGGGQRGITEALEEPH